MDMNAADRLIDNLIEAIDGAHKAKKRDDKQWWEERVYVAREVLFKALTQGRYDASGNVAARPVPKHRAPDLYDDQGLARYVCECGAVDGLHEFGVHRDCEYRNHHCDACHARGACTAHEIA